VQDDFWSLKEGKNAFMATVISENLVKHCILSTPKVIRSSSCSVCEHRDDC